MASAADADGHVVSGSSCCVRGALAWPPPAAPAIRRGRVLPGRARPSESRGEVCPTRPSAKRTARASGWRRSPRCVRCGLYPRLVLSMLPPRHRRSPTRWTRPGRTGLPHPDWLRPEPGVRPRGRDPRGFPVFPAAARERNPVPGIRRAGAATAGPGRQTGAAIRAGGPGWARAGSPEAAAPEWRGSGGRGEVATRWRAGTRKDPGARVAVSARWRAMPVADPGTVAPGDAAVGVATASDLHPPAAMEASPGDGRRRARQ